MRQEDAGSRIYSYDTTVNVHGEEGRHESTFGFGLRTWRGVLKEVVRICAAAA